MPSLWCGAATPAALHPGRSVQSVRLPARPEVGFVALVVRNGLQVEHGGVKTYVVVSQTAVSVSLGCSGACHRDESCQITAELFRQGAYCDVRAHRSRGTLGAAAPSAFHPRPV